MTAWLEVVVGVRIVVWRDSGELGKAQSIGIGWAYGGHRSMPRGVVVVLRGPGLLRWGWFGRGVGLLATLSAARRPLGTADYYCITN